MSVFFKGTDAKIGKLIGLGTGFVALMIAADGYFLGATLAGLAGALLWFMSSPNNSAPVSFGIKLAWGLLIFLAFLFVG